MPSIDGDAGMDESPRTASSLCGSSRISSRWPRTARSAPRPHGCSCRRRRSPPPSPNSSAPSAPTCGAAPCAGRLPHPDRAGWCSNRAKRLLSDGGGAELLVRGNGTELVGPLVVGCFVTLAPTVLPRLLAEFEELHPRVTLDFVEGPQDQLGEALLAGEIEAAVLYDMGLLEELDRIVLYEARAYALLGQSHPLADQPTVTLEQLASEPLVLFDQTAKHELRHVAVPGPGARAEHPSPHPRLRAHRSIVARGIGYAILVQRPANKLSYEGLPILEKEIEPPVPTCPVILAWPRHRRLSPRVRALADLARRQYPASGG